MVWNASWGIISGRSSVPGHVDMTKHSKGFPYEPQETEDAPIECYKSLAGAIVARAIEDYCIVQIFYRDDEMGRFDRIYQKVADHQYKKWVYLLESHASKKRECRKSLRNCEQQMEIINKRIQTNRDAMTAALNRISENDKQLARVRKWKPRSSEDERMKKELQSDIRNERARNERKVRTSTEKIEDLFDEALPFRKEIARCRKKLKHYKETENYDHRTFHPGYHRNEVMRRARTEEREILKWFQTPEFEILSPLSAEAVVYQSERAVYERKIDRANKFIFFLPTDGERGEGNNTYQRTGKRYRKDK